MDKKVGAVNEKNANQIFKFYTLHQRDVENSLKLSVYAQDNSVSKPEPQKHDTPRPSSIEGRSSSEPRLETTTEVSLSALPKTRGEKVLDRMAKACAFNKPPEFEYWDFGYQGRKTLVKTGRHYSSRNFKKVLSSLQSCNKELSKTPNKILIRSTFHENMAKSRVDSKTAKGNETSSIKMETTYGHLLNYNKASENSKKALSFRGERTSTQFTRSSPKGSSSHRLTRVIPTPYIETTYVLNGRKCSTNENLETEEGSEKILRVSGPFQTTKKASVYRPDCFYHPPHHSSMIARLLPPALK